VPHVSPARGIASCRVCLDSSYATSWAGGCFVAFPWMATTDAEAVRARVAELDWWHTIEVAPGVVTPGGWDLRPTAERLPWPSSLAGMRCLDIGTMDGFWAFELERRGASEVIASDVLDAKRLDHFASDRLRGQQSRRASERNFALAAELRGSRIELRELNVYDLDPDEIGEFDLVVMGYVLQMLRDPLRGLEAVRRVCRGHLILLDTVSRPLELLHAPLARLDARRDGSEWFVFNRRGLRKALELAGWVVEESTPVVRDHAGPGVGARERGLSLAMHILGIRGRSAAIRARPLDESPRRHDR
jgi:tRNA (mo5U34)-methyltransferase